MKPLTFFHREDVRRMLRRAATAAGMPLSIHYIADEQEGPLVFGVGSCRACRYVDDQPDGRKACRASRNEAGPSAMRRGRPTPFICHMGFACVSVPALPEIADGFVLTLGPYCPAEAPHSLERDALHGLDQLDHEPEETFPVPLDDIHLAPSDSPPEVADWITADLVALWETLDEPETTEAELPPPAPKPRRKTAVPAGQTYPADAIATALAVGDQTRARVMVRGVVAEMEAAGADIRVARSGMVALAGATLEAAERAALNTEECWDQFPAFVQEARQASNGSECVDAAMALFAILIRRTRRGGGATDSLAELNRIVSDRLAEGVTLAEVAERLGRNPTTLTHQLKRKLDMTFTQYLGRMRIDKAKDLLRRTGLGVGEVARRVGVADSSNFSKLFKKYEGVSPQQYRRHIKGPR